MLGWGECQSEHPMSNKSTTTSATMGMILVRICSISLASIDVPRYWSENGHAARSKLSAMPPRRIGLEHTSPDLKFRVYGRGPDVGVQARQRPKVG